MAISRTHPIEPHLGETRPMAHPEILCLDSHKARVTAFTGRGAGRHYLVAMLYMAPYTFGDGVHNLCPSARECVRDCLWRSGQAKLGLYARAAGTGRATVADARIRLARQWIRDRDGLLWAIREDIRRVLRLTDRWSTGPKPKWLQEIRLARGERFIPAIRLNGTSDIAWESVRYAGKTFFEMFPTTQFYDYTKIATRAIRFSETRRTTWPKNYHLTFSMGGKEDERLLDVLASGCNATVVFDGAVPKSMPAQKFQVLGRAGKPILLDLPRMPVLYGDEDDLRFLDPKGVIVGLRYKQVFQGVKDPNFVRPVPEGVSTYSKNPDDDDMPDQPADPNGTAIQFHRLGCGGYGPGWGYVNR